MEFPTSFATLTIPTGAGQGNNRLFIDSNGCLFSFDVTNRKYVELCTGTVFWGHLNANGSIDGSVGPATASGNFPVGLPPQLLIASPTNATDDTSSQIELNAGVFGSTLGTSTDPTIKLVADPGLSTSLMVGVAGAVVSLDMTSGALQNFNVWQDPTYAANWAGNTNWNGIGAGLYQTLQYRLDAEDNVWIYGMAQANAAGTTIFMLPTGYRPPTGSRAMLDANFNIGGTAISGHVQVLENGNVTCPTSVSGSSIIIANGSQVYINGKFPLKNLP